MTSYQDLIEIGERIAPQTFRKIITWFAAGTLVGLVLYGQCLSSL